jgi:signal peptidase I
MPVTTEAREVQKLELASEVLGASGTIRLQALGTSMLPAIWPGDVVSIERKPADETVPGDIVLVVLDGRFFVHRLIKKRDCQWITRGDSLPQNDPAVGEAQVLGRVSRVHRRNRVIVPQPRLSVLGRILASLICWSDVFRSFALRVHSLSSASFYILLVPWPLRSHLRVQDATATAGKMPAPPEM